ncbi:MAG: substrate-binding domain-containing protein [Eubacteriales bacterium]|nr:substrate-binding domain-containing protein [bacterium]MDY2791392.1 substrate-binding domain-containing protein [Eubacteriales bacterium]
MKKIVSLLLCLALVLGLSTMALADGEKTIYILTPTEDHGWTGSVATFAKMSADEINAAGSYKAEVKTAASAAEQIPQIEDIIANNAADVAGVVILPQDDTVEFAIQQLVDANIPYVAFDRIIAGVKDSAVANVKGDNAGVGKAVAEYFISLGMKAGDEVIVFEGDTSSVTADRDAGFTDYLKEQGWTEDDLAKITFSGAMNWSRSAAKEYFESLMSDSKNASIKWFYSQDDEFAMGIMEALKGSAIDDATKQAILDNKIVISAAGGSENLYKIMRGEDAEYADLFASFGGLAVATYSPAMIQDAVKLMVNHLNGEEVAQDYVVPVEIVTAENVASYVGFN